MCLRDSKSPSASSAIFILTLSALPAADLEGLVISAVMDYHALFLSYSVQLHVIVIENTARYSLVYNNGIAKK